MALILPFNGKPPRWPPDAFLAPTAVLIGDVEVGCSSFHLVRSRPPRRPSRIRNPGRIQDQHSGQLRGSCGGLAAHRHRGRCHRGPRGQVRELHHRGRMCDRDQCRHPPGGQDRGGLPGGSQQRGPGRDPGPAGSLVAGVPGKVRKALEGSAAEFVRRSAAHYVEASRAYRFRRSRRELECGMIPSWSPAAADCLRSAGSLGRS